MEAGAATYLTVLRLVDGFEFNVFEGPDEVLRRLFSPDGEAVQGGYATLSWRSGGGPSPVYVRPDAVAFVRPF
jgi:hypothetical protein